MVVVFDPTMVSTLAPVKGATITFPDGILFPLVSTLAPVKGATSKGATPNALKNGFNSRSREGSDNFFKGLLIPFRSFNSRSREGSDNSKFT